jgi:transcriptional regulator with XRE-family HTH domain
VTNSIFTERYDRFRLSLIEARNAKDFTQVELAKKLKRPQSFVSKYERGERRLDVVEFFEVARALGIDPIVFLKELYGATKERS